MTPAPDAAREAVEAIQSDREVALSIRLHIHSLRPSDSRYDRMTAEYRDGSRDGSGLVQIIAHYRQSLTEAASQPREGDLPAILPGHWTTPAGRDMALATLDDPHMARSRERISDFALANEVFLSPGIANLTDAKERIRWLSATLAALTQRPPEQAGAVPAGWISKADALAVVVRCTPAAAGGPFSHTNSMRCIADDIYRGIDALYAPTPPEAGPGELPAGMVAWHGGDSAPADWDGGKVLLERGEMGDGNVWDHHPSRAPTRIIAYTPKAPPQTPPDAGIGSDGAGS